MKTPQDLAETFLPQVNVMQLATCSDNKPYAVNLHYYSDPDQNVYWISELDRRHSLDISKNPQACIVIKVHENTTQEPWVIGLSLEGTVEYLGEDPGDTVAAAYQLKLDKPDELMEQIKNGTNPHKFYRLKPTHVTLFDTKNFPDEPKQQWSLA